MPTTWVMTTLLANPRAVDAGPGAPPTALARDSQIEVLRSLLAARPTATLSLDCFDTLLWRSVPKPTDVFWLLGHRLHDLGLLQPQATPQLFMKLRVVTEQALRNSARAQRNSGEVRLAEIYSVPGWTRYTRCTGPELVRHELAVERDVTTADPWMLELLRTMAAAGDDRRCVVVSDSYLDADAIRELLVAAGFDMLAEVPVVVSSEHGVSKAEGLLGVAATRLGFDPADCIHVGNSVDSDVNAAVAAGMATVHLAEHGALSLPAVTAEGWLPAAGEPGDLLHPIAGDSGLTAVRGRMSRRRPAEVGPADAVYWDVGATLLGPVMTGFAEWVHERAGAMGIETALCLMREGRFLARLLDGVPATRRTCRAVPFWASREACIRASFFSASAEELTRVLWRAEAPTPEAVLATVGLRPEEVPGGPAVLAAIARIGTPADVARAFLQHLGSDAATRDLIVRRSTARRKAFIEYLRSSVQGDGRTVALVDLGFGATIQELLHGMARAEGLTIDFRGLYLFTTHRALLRQCNGHVAEGFVADAGSPATHTNALDRSPELLETTTTSAEGSLLEIGADGRPVLVPRAPEGEQDCQRVLVQNGMLAFQREWHALEAANTLRHWRPLGAAPEVLHRMLFRLISRPGRTVAEAFADWEHEANCGSERRDPLVPEAIRRCAGYLAPEHLVLSNNPDLYWVGAGAAFAGLDEEVGWIQEGVAKVGRFLRPDTGERLQLAALLPGDRRQSLTEMPLNWSRTGDGAIAWSGVADSRRFELRTSGTAAVVRIDQVTVSRGDGSVEHLDFRGTPRSEPAGLQVGGDGVMAPGVALVSDHQPLVLAFAGKGGVPVTGVEVLYHAMAA